MVSPGVFPLPALRGGGAESHVWDLANELARSGHEVHLISDVVTRAHLPEGIVPYSTHSPRMSSDKGFFGWIANLSAGGVFASGASLKALAKKTDFDIIHVHQAISPLIFRLMENLIGDLPPVICTVHSPPLSYESYTGIRRFLRRISYHSLLSRGWLACDHLIGSSSQVCRDLIGTWKITPERVTYVPQGVNTEIFSPGAVGKEEAQAKFGIPSKYCIFVGHMSTRKGPDILLKALAEVECHGVLVGGGPLLKRLINLANNLGISQRVVFTGPVGKTDLVRLYAGASMFVFPSRSEGAAIAPLEAMACGLPVILSDIPGSRDYVTPESNGYLVGREDVEGLAKAIDILIKDDSSRAVMGRQSRLIALKKFSWPFVARETFKVYCKAVESSSC